MKLNQLFFILLIVKGLCFADNVTDFQDSDEPKLSNHQQFVTLGINTSIEDADNDGIRDDWEITLGLNPQLGDSDGDGLSDAYELAFQGDVNSFAPRVGDRVRYDLTRLGYQGTYKLLGSLPKGLVFNSDTGILEGKLTGTPKINKLTIQVLNGKILVKSIPFNIPVQAFPSSLTGKWQALIQRKVNEQWLPQGLITIVVSSPGILTASYDGVGTNKILTTRGSFDLSPSSDLAMLNLTFAATKTSPQVSAKVEIHGQTAMVSGNLENDEIQGFRLARDSELPFMNQTIIMLMDQGVQDGIIKPAGKGWATGIFSKLGVLSLKGQLGDAQAFKATLALGATGQALLWIKPYKNLNSYIGGVVSLHGSGVLPSSRLHFDDSGLVWYRAADPRELSYQEGFEPLQTSAELAPLISMANALGLTKNLGPNEQVALQASFQGAALDNPANIQQLPEKFLVDAKYSLQAASLRLQPSVIWKGMINSRSGNFSGSLGVAKDENHQIITGTAAVSGVFFPQSDGLTIASGLVKIPIAGVKGAFRTAAILLDRDSVSPDMTLVPAGDFLMGRTSGDTDADAPSVKISVSGFYMGKHEITKALWDDVRTWAVVNGYSNLAEGAGKALEHPVQNVSWWDAVRWCNARSEKEGLTPCYWINGEVMREAIASPTVNWSANGYRLPTEAEWEKAARGGVMGKRFPWGEDTINHSQANYLASLNYKYDTSGRGPNYYHPSYSTGAAINEPYTSPVGAFVANRFGLYDMAGNVDEWCWDWYGASVYTNGAIDPIGPAAGVNRVCRGGSWLLQAVASRSCARRSVGPINRFYNIGFRIVRGVIP